MFSQASFVSVVIVCWNSAKYLTRCLKSLNAQTFSTFEIVVVDNGSDDDALDGLCEKYPSLELHFHKLDSNLGFATANNVGAHLARGKWITLLNVDAFPEPDWLENLIKVAEQNPGYAAFSSRQIQYNAPHLLDGAGDVYHISGLAWRNGYNLPAKAYGIDQREIFSPCAAAALYDREAFLKIGGFDEDYFSYFEDVDIGFRLRLNGEKCLYVPEAVVYHVGSASTGKRSDFSVYYGYRNMIWTFVKDMPSPYFWLFLPLHISAVLFFAFYLTLRGQGRAIWKAIVDAILGLPKMLTKRKSIQADLKSSSGDIFKVMALGLFEPYTEFIHRNHYK